MNGSTRAWFWTDEAAPDDIEWMESPEALAASSRRPVRGLATPWPKIKACDPAASSTRASYPPWPSPRRRPSTPRIPASRRRHTPPGFFVGSASPPPPPPSETLPASDEKKE
jgi:hypothetical protein